MTVFSASGGIAPFLVCYLVIATRRHFLDSNDVARSSRPLPFSLLGVVYAYQGFGCGEIDERSLKNGNLCASHQPPYEQDGEQRCCSRKVEYSLVTNAQSHEI